MQERYKEAICRTKRMLVDKLESRSELVKITVVVVVGIIETIEPSAVQEIPLTAQSTVNK